MVVSSWVSNGDICDVASVTLDRKFVLATGATSAVYSDFLMKAYAADIVVGGRTRSTIEMVGAGAYSTSRNVVYVVETISREGLAAHYAWCRGRGLKRFWCIHCFNGRILRRWGTMRGRERRRDVWIRV
jgi:hypothetical protein